MILLKTSYPTTKQGYFTMSNLLHNWIAETTPKTPEQAAKRRGTLAKVGATAVGVAMVTFGCNLTAQHLGSAEKESMDHVADTATLIVTGGITDDNLLATFTSTEKLEVAVTDGIWRNDNPNSGSWVCITESTAGQAMPGIGLDPNNKDNLVCINGQEASLLST